MLVLRYEVDKEKFLIGEIFREDKKLFRFEKLLSSSLMSQLVRGNFLAKNRSEGRRILKKLYELFIEPFESDELLPGPSIDPDIKNIRVLVPYFLLSVPFDCASKDNKNLFFNRYAMCLSSEGLSQPSELRQYLPSNFRACIYVHLEEDDDKIGDNLMLIKEALLIESELKEKFPKSEPTIFTNELSLWHYFNSRTVEVFRSLEEIGEAHIFSYSGHTTKNDWFESQLQLGQAGTYTGMELYSKLKLITSSNLQLAFLLGCSTGTPHHPFPHMSIAEAFLRCFPGIRLFACQWEPKFEEPFYFMKYFFDSLDNGKSLGVIRYESEYRFVRGHQYSPTGIALLAHPNDHLIFEVRD